jgi:hypothetical protein
MLAGWVMAGGMLMRILLREFWPDSNDVDLFRTANARVHLGDGKFVDDLVGTRYEYAAIALGGAQHVEFSCNEDPDEKEMTEWDYIKRARNCPWAGPTTDVVRSLVSAASAAVLAGLAPAHRGCETQNSCIYDANTSLEAVGAVYVPLATGALLNIVPLRELVGITCDLEKGPCRVERGTSVWMISTKMCKRCKSRGRDTFSASVEDRVFHFDLEFLRWHWYDARGYMELANRSAVLIAMDNGALSRRYSSAPSEDNVHDGWWDAARSKARVEKYTGRGFEIGGSKM